MLDNFHEKTRERKFMHYEYKSIPKEFNPDI